MASTSSSSVIYYTDYTSCTTSDLVTSTSTGSFLTTTPNTFAVSGPETDQWRSPLEEVDEIDVEQLNKAPKYKLKSKLIKDAMDKLESEATSSIQSRKQYNLKSNLIKELIDKLEFGSSIQYGTSILLYSPMVNIRRDPVHHDISLLSNNIYNKLYKFPIISYNGLVTILSDVNKHFTFILIIGVLEHIINNMAKALFLKSLLGKLDPNCALVVITKSHKQIQLEARLNNYPKCNKNSYTYLVALPNGKQAELRGVDQDELYNLAVYGRFESLVSTTDKLNINDPHIIFSNRL